MKNRNCLLIVSQLCLILVMSCFIAASAQAQTPANDNQSDTNNTRARKSPFSLSFAAFGFRSMSRANGSSASNVNFAPMAAPNLQVLGSGTLGRLTKWTGLTSSSSFIGDSTIFEDKFGKVGIGTDSPTSRLTVAGMIQTTLGGVKFPDGTIQTTAALGGLQFVFTDSTLKGDGTSASPLGVHIPLTLTGFAPSENLLTVRNLGDGGGGIISHGGDSDTDGGNGVEAVGGVGETHTGGAGVASHGGNGVFGGAGVLGLGGSGSNGSGGIGGLFFGGVGNGSGHIGGPGIFAQGGRGNNGATDGFAGQFFGDVQVTGNLSKGGGSFKIDHPLDPENKYLYHSFVESPDMMNIYNGNAVTDANGDAVVELPAYFEALNRDFRYQLTVIGTFARAIVSSEIRGDHFRIKTDVPNVKVSWQVTGIRQDAYANKHRIPVEEAKPQLERGTYLHPDSFNQTAEKASLFVQNRHSFPK